MYENFKPAWMCSQGRFENPRGHYYFAPTAPPHDIVDWRIDTEVSNGLRHALVQAGYRVSKPVYVRTLAMPDRDRAQWEEEAEEESNVCNS